jgi:hypothetical protein
MSDVEWLSYSALAERLGISREGARIKAVRARWTKTTDPASNDGGVLVAVPKTVLDAVVTLRGAYHRQSGVPGRRKRTKGGVSAQPVVNRGADAGVETELAAIRARLEAVKQERDRLRQETTPMSWRGSPQPTRPTAGTYAPIVIDSSLFSTSRSLCSGRSPRLHQPPRRVSQLIHRQSSRQ